MLVLSCSEKKNAQTKSDTPAFSDSALLHKGATAEQSSSEPEEPELQTTPVDTQTQISQEHPAAAKQNTAASQNAAAGSWDAYYQARDKAKAVESNAQYQEAIRYLLQAAEAALSLDRPGIAAWQYNNAGKNAIDHFKQQTNWPSATQRINSMSYSEEKTELQQKLLTASKEHFTILEEATIYLQKAQQYDRQNPDDSRREVIQSNQKFIDTVRKFISAYDA